MNRAANRAAARKLGLWIPEPPRPSTVAYREYVALRDAAGTNPYELRNAQHRARAADAAVDAAPLVAVRTTAPKHVG